MRGRASGVHSYLKPFYMLLLLSRSNPPRGSAYGLQRNPLRGSVHGPQKKSPTGVSLRAAQKSPTGADLRIVNKSPTGVSLRAAKKSPTGAGLRAAKNTPLRGRPPDTNCTGGVRAPWWAIKRGRVGSRRGLSRATLWTHLRHGP